MKAQPDSPAHTVGGACQPPSKLGGYPQGTVWCCATCKAFWYVNGHEWEFLSRLDQIPPEPPLVLPTEPTWGIAVGRYSVGFFAKWVRDGEHLDAGEAWRPERWLIEDVLDFIPLTDEQVARIEAAR